MKLRRRAKRQPDEQPHYNSASPKAGAQKYRQSWILTLGNLLHFVMSHRGLFTFALCVFLLAMWLNFNFYFALLGIHFGMGFFAKVGVASLVSFGTTLFECLPLFQQHRKGMLHQIFLAASKPRQLPHLDPAVVGDRQRLIKDYKWSDARNRRLLSLCRWGAIGFESLLGLSTLGSLGTGFSGLVKLGVFAFSIVGAEWGARIGLSALDQELAAPHQAQLDELINNPEKLALRGVESNE